MTKENEGCWLTDRCSRVDCDRFCLRRFKLAAMYDDALVSDRQRRHMDLYVDKDGSADEKKLNAKLTAFNRTKPFDMQVSKLVVTRTPLPRTATGKVKRWML